MQAAAFQADSLISLVSPVNTEVIELEKTHQSTMIFKYQNIFHFVKILSLPNKINANTVIYA